MFLESLNINDALTDVRTDVATPAFQTVSLWNQAIWLISSLTSVHVGLSNHRKIFNFVFIQECRLSQ